MTCETIKKYGCCPLNYNCDKPLTEECQKCLEDLSKEETDMADHETCACIKLLLDKGYIQQNLLRTGQYFVYPIRKNKIVPEPVLIKFCPICGLRLCPICEGKRSDLKKAQDNG